MGKEIKSSGFPAAAVRAGETHADGIKLLVCLLVSSRKRRSDNQGEEIHMTGLHRACLSRAVLALGTLGILLASSPARTQEYPNRDIHAICNFPAGTGADIYVRYFSEK